MPVSKKEGVIRSPRMSISCQTKEPPFFAIGLVFQNIEIGVSGDDHMR